MKSNINNGTVCLNKQEIALCQQLAVNSKGARESQMRKAAVMTALMAHMGFAHMLDLPVSRALSLYQSLEHNGWRILVKGHTRIDGDVTQGSCQLAKSLKDQTLPHLLVSCHVDPYKGNVTFQGWCTVDRLATARRVGCDKPIWEPSGCIAKDDELVLPVTAFRGTLAQLHDLVNGQGPSCHQTFEVEQAIRNTLMQFDGPGHPAVGIVKGINLDAYFAGRTTDLEAALTV